MPSMVSTPEMSVALGLILEERARQITLHGPETDISWERRIVILVEEIGEICKAIQDEGVDAIQRETVHAAAVAMAIVEATLREGRKG